jgi:hypothetical protein
VADGIEDTDAINLKQLKTVVENFNNINDIQVIKPVFDIPMHIRLSAYNDENMNTCVFNIDSHEQVTYFSAFLNSSEKSEWKQFTTDGIGREYNNSPVLIKITDILKTIENGNTYKKLFI